MVNLRQNVDVAAAHGIGIAAVAAGDLAQLAGQFAQARALTANGGNGLHRAALAGIAHRYGTLLATKALHGDRAVGLHADIHAPTLTPGRRV